MPLRQIRVASLIWLSAGLPIWLFLMATVPLSTGFGGGNERFVVAPLVLSGFAMAIRVFLPDRPAGLHLLFGHHCLGRAEPLALVIGLASLGSGAKYRPPKRRQAAARTAKRVN